MVKDNALFSARALTAQDITDLCQYQCDDRISDKLLDKAIKAYGSFVKSKLYRGLTRD